MDAISRADARWFRRHKGKTVRYRQAGANEWPPELLSGPPLEVPGTTAVLMVEVFQLAPGVRVRKPYWVIQGVAS